MVKRLTRLEKLAATELVQYTIPDAWAPFLVRHGLASSETKAVELCVKALRRAWQRGQRALGLHNATNGDIEHVSTLLEEVNNGKKTAEALSAYPVNPRHFIPLLESELNRREGGRRKSLHLLDFVEWFIGNRNKQGKRATPSSLISWLRAKNHNKENPYRFNGKASIYRTPNGCLHITDEDGESFKLKQNGLKRYFTDARKRMRKRR